MINREYRKGLLAKYARSEGDDLLLAKVLDKAEACQRSGAPQSTRFLTPRDLQCCQPMLAELGARYVLWGGYPEAERLCLTLTADWQSPEDVYHGPGCPVAVLRADFHSETPLSHRDFLGALMGLGVERDAVGDIIPRETSCDLVVLRELRDFMLTEFDQAGRTKLRLTVIDQAEAQDAPFRLMRDTVASLRLDAVVGVGFSLAREKAAAAIRTGKVSLDGVECLKPDRPVGQGARITMRGLGKIVLQETGGLSKKGRTIIQVRRYL